VGLYVRVSTHEQQTIPLQTRAMRQCATIAMQIRKVGSGAVQGQSRENQRHAACRLENR
jgi:hypothetical protein